ncbi:MAG TPA: glycerol-3-phosphate 1-O-acyltransferase PlsY [Methylophilaceae bacterium]|jgi:glycerol-3-phosphate acyltransferase PlsY
MSSLLFVFAAYLLGSVSFGVVMSKAFGLPDPHSYGSGNPGATNVLRSGKKLAAALTLFGDAAKGWLPVWLALHMGLALNWVDAIAAAVFVGHIYPCFYGFKGGKGVATAFGILLAFSPLVALCAFATWIAVFAIWRISSLAAIVAGSSSVLYAGLILGWDRQVLMYLAIGLALIWRHKANIQRLLKGEESGFRKTR